MLWVFVHPSLPHLNYPCYNTAFYLCFWYHLWTQFSSIMLIILLKVHFIYITLLCPKLFKNSTLNTETTSYTKRVFFFKSRWHKNLNLLRQTKLTPQEWSMECSDYDQRLINSKQNGGCQMNKICPFESKGNWEIRNNYTFHQYQASYKAAQETRSDIL